MTSSQFFRVERLDAVLVVTFLQSAGSASSARIGSEFEQVRTILEDPTITGMVVDFQGAPYFGSAVLELLLRFWSRIMKRGGKMALCNVSQPGRQVLRVCKLERLWSVLATREQAVLAVAG